MTNSHLAFSSSTSYSRLPAWKSMGLIGGVASPAPVETSVNVGAESAGDIPPRIVVDDLAKRYALGGKDLDVLEGVSLCVAPGEFVSLIGPSGCGKSTLLRILAGLDEPTRGRVEIDRAGRVQERR